MPLHSQPRENIPITNALRAAEYINAFGWQGLVLSVSHFMKYKLPHRRLLVPTRIPHGDTIHLRPGTSDLSIFREIFVSGQYDFEEHSIFDRIKQQYDALCKRGRRPLIVDAGANIGLASIFLAKHFPEADFELIEADEVNAAVARVNMASRKNMRLHTRALWYERTTLSLLPSDEFSTVRVKANGQNVGARRVETITMADIIRGREEDLLIVKMDIEGAEREVLSRNNDWLKAKPVIMIEPHDGALDTAGSLAGLLAFDSYRKGAILVKGPTLLFAPDDSSKQAAITIAGP
jgi:FkbM family methyltransferase